MRTFQPILLLLLLTPLLATACGGAPPETADETKQVRGRILEVVARNIAEVELLRVRDEAGREYSFTTEGFVEFTPSHLKEHQLFGQPVLVSYLEKNGQLVMVKVED